MKLPTNKQIENRREIRIKLIKKLSDKTTQITGSGETDHSHNNLTFLNSLGIDSNKRLTINAELIKIPLSKEDW